MERLAVHDGQQSCMMLREIRTIRLTTSLERRGHTRLSLASTDLIGHSPTLTKKQCALARVERGREWVPVQSRIGEGSTRGLSVVRSFKNVKLESSC